MSNQANPNSLQAPEATPRRTDRRTFLKWIGVGAGAAVGAGTVAGCDLLVPGVPAGPFPTITLDFSTDFGVLNYAYVLEQLEALFYQTVAGGFYAGVTDEERRVLTDLRDHEVAHRDYFEAAINALGGSPAQPISADFSSVDLGSRTAVLQTARTFEDLGVSAYNGAGRLLRSATLLLVAGKIVSVEARHASVIRDLLQPRTTFFAGDDVVDANGLDVARTPQEVLAAAAPFIRNQFRVVGL